jgi:hypothetical protein
MEARPYEHSPVEGNTVEGKININLNSILYAGKTPEEIKMIKARNKMNLQHIFNDAINAYNPSVTLRLRHSLRRTSSSIRNLLKQPLPYDKEKSNTKLMAKEYYEKIQEALHNLNSNNPKLYNTFVKLKRQVVLVKHAEHVVLLGNVIT